MADVAVAPAAAAAPVETSALPRLTAAQLLALAAFLIFAGLAFLPDTRVSDGEFDEIRKLAVFLIGALLPSDVVIRFGRALFVRGQEDDSQASTISENPTSAMPHATIPQYAAFVAFAAVVVAALWTRTLISGDEFSDINDVAVFLIAALLPSEATVRFARALYLRGAANVTDAHLKRI